MGECDYVHGNLYARNLVHYIQDILETMGIERERIQMMFVSAAEGERFRQLAIKMDTTIRKLGPSKIRLYQQTAAAKAAEKARKKSVKGK